MRRIGWLLSLLFAVFVAAIPSSAFADPGPTSLTIESPGTATQLDNDLIVGPVTLVNHGTTPVAQAQIQFDLLFGSPFKPFSFDVQTNRDCEKLPGLPAYTVTCTYAIGLEPGGTANVLADLLVSGSTEHGPQSTDVRITLGDESVTIPIDRVKQSADLALSIDDSDLYGEVGDVIDLPWTITNLGPNTLPKREIRITLIAPPGTEWTGDVAAQCNPPTIPKTKYVCVSDYPVAAGQTLSETWQLKITSPEVGEGRIEIAPVTGQPVNPYFEVPDPNRENNVVTYRVTLAHRTDTAAAAQLPTTGLPLSGILAGGLALLFGGLVAVVAVRRRSVGH